MNRAAATFAAVALIALAGCGSSDGGKSATPTTRRTTTTANLFADAARRDYPLVVGPWERAIAACQSYDGTSNDVTVDALTRTMEAANAAAEAISGSKGLAVGSALVLAGANESEVGAHFDGAKNALVNCWKDGVGEAGDDLDWLKSQVAEHFPDW